MSKDYPLKIRNFEYNGFSGIELRGNAPFKARFKRWTNDPGIGLFECSDGKERLIPTFAIRNFSKQNLPKSNVPEEKKVLFGVACNSK